MSNNAEELLRHGRAIRVGSGIVRPTGGGRGTAARSGPHRATLARMGAERLWHLLQTEV